MCEIAVAYTLSILQCYPSVIYLVKLKRKGSVVARGLREGNKQSSTEDFQGNENLGDDTVTCVIYIVTCVSNLTEWTPPRGNSNVNRGLWW